MSDVNNDDNPYLAQSRLMWLPNFLSTPETLGN